jgi:[ribosomal protein S5]-alanine N-acetyltransferase
VPEPLRLVTERLVLTPFDQARDWSSFVADLVLDREVTRYWADFADPGLSDADKERLAADEFLPWFDDGRGRGLVVWTLRTADGSFVGVSGLTIPGPPVGGTDPEFGCMLGTRWHGRGLATEAGRAILDDGWSRLGLARIITVMDSPNPASRRLVDKLGFRFDGVVFDDEHRPYVRFAWVHDPGSRDAAGRPVS